MSGSAILCPGQGNQSPAMFDLFANEPAAASVFEAARKVLDGRDPRDIAHQGGELLHRNDFAQVLCCTATLAAWAVLGPSLPRPQVIAGYSAGEIAAWSVAGLMDAPTALTLIAQRAALMDRATQAPAGLAAIVGLPRNSIDDLCRKHALELAIINGPNHFIIGGCAANLEVALIEARQKGALRALRLPIQVASHTSALRTASQQFLEVLRERVVENTPIPANLRLISGVDGSQVRSIATGIGKLAAQISTTIDWVACMDRCQTARPNYVIELGPGDALARMLRTTAPNIPTHSIANFKSIRGIEQWIHSVKNA